MKTINTIIVITILIIALMHCFVRFTGTETDSIVPVPEQETAQDNTAQPAVTFDESAHEQDTVRNDGVTLVESSDINISFDSDKTQNLIEQPLHWGEVRVAEVIAGDVLLLENGKTVKLIGVDVDAMVSTEATALTKRAMQDSSNIVILLRDGVSTDEQGRQLAIVYFYYEKGGVKENYHLNHVLIWHGLAKAQTQGNYSQVRKDSFIQAEKDAQQRKVGIWRDVLQTTCPMGF